MKVSNWIKAGRRSKKMDNAIVNVHCNPKGSNGIASWDDYVQIKIYSKEKEKFIRLDMTLKEAKDFQEKINIGMKKFNA
ncbi:hypothetical protein Phi46:1_gp45 [Cellulophaga phage phi46:1]|uniref:hypothetical protein n=1 Tax=Cellulophaga phage phi46:1 TaxID=1327974 RepID=UPI000351F162|nr:hypothetical protein Phi46:1_gp45 [Cellulophaga phage phi46:1]AGO47856.1 hypothetical protein Phi46:1_gp45 [Cellulophaga phage phi46:1]